jgi:NAD(P)-dependent dehydrogenase (short-subunit alcohol dehydrogenase family)
VTDTERHVVVTGGTGALGTAVVTRLVASGAHCHVTWLFDREIANFAHRASCALHHVDCGDETEVSAFYASLPRVDASIHLVGGFEMAPLEGTTLEAFERMFRLNARTAFLCSREAVRRMRAVGGGGRIVNVAARPAVEPTGGMIAYAVSKAAVAALTRALAEEVRPEGILVNAILPSIIDTPANRSAMPNADHDAWPKPADLAETIEFLASPENRVTSGALVPVYGRA